MNSDKYLIVPGTDYWVLKNDSALTRDAMTNHRFICELSIQELAEVQELQPGDLVLDIGAFVGDTARIFLNRGCRVMAFEAYPDAFECLQHNCPEAIIFNVPVGNGIKMLANNVFGEPNSNYGTRMVSPGIGNPSLRIDDLIDKMDGLKFVKLDIEGCEPWAIDGMKNTLEKYHPKILVECYDTMLKKQGFRREDITENLKQMGYKYRVAIGNEKNDRVDLLFYR
jgi:FkbM family methyltransferase